MAEEKNQSIDQAHALRGDFQKRLERAVQATGEELRLLLNDPAKEVLQALLGNANLAEPEILLLLQRTDLPGEVVQELARRKEWIAGYRVKLAVAKHPHTPRLVSMALLKFLHLFDLMAISLLPTVPAEIQQQASEMIVTRLGQLPLGQKLTLARRGPARVLAALLAEAQPQVVPVALDNPRLTEPVLLRLLVGRASKLVIIREIARHKKWSFRRDIRFALIRNAGTPEDIRERIVAQTVTADLERLMREGDLPTTALASIRKEIERRRTA
jgi:hypothetical protein